MNLAAFSVKRPVMMLMGVLMVLVLGAISLSRLPIDLMPDITYPTLSVVTTYANAGPHEIEELVTRPIEEAMSAVPGVDQVRSVSSEGSSSVRVSFTWGTDLDAAANDIRDRLDRVIPRLPEDIERPMLRKFDLASRPIMVIGAASELDPHRFAKLIEEQVKYRIERVPGVAALDIRGGVSREIHVLLDATKINALKLRLDQVLDAVRLANVNLPAGVVEQGNQQALVRTPAEFRTLDEIRRTIIETRGGAPVRLGEIGEVRDGWARTTRVVRVGDRPGIQLAVNKQAGTNTVEVARAVKAEIDAINAELPLVTLLVRSDSSRYIEDAISNLGTSILQGGVLAVLILLVFLRSVRSTLVIGLSIPISIVATFVLMYFNGFTLNLMSLGGLALGVGMLVDNSIVVLETVFRHIHERRSSPRAASIDGTHEVGSAIVSSTVTTVVVFVPLIFVRGLAGEMFRQLAWVVSFSLLCSVVVALTIVPLLCSRILAGPGGGGGGWISRTLAALFDGLDRLYARVLVGCLENRTVVVVAALATLVGTAALVPRIGVEMMPATDEGEVRLSVETATGTRLAFLDQRFRPLEDIVRREVPEAKGSVSVIGGGGFGSSGSNTAEMRVMLVPRDQRKRSSEEIASHLRKKLAGIPGMKVRVRAGQGLLGGRLGGNAEESLQVEVRGHNIDAGDRLAARVAEVIGQVSGVTDVRLSRESGSPEELVVVDRDKAAALNLSVRGVAEMLETALAGKRVGYLREGGDEYPLVVKVKDAEQMGLSQILDLTMMNGDGLPVVLSNVVTPRSRLGPSRIERTNQERLVTVSGNLSGRDLGAVIADARVALADIPLPEGFTLTFGGDHEEQQRSFRELVLMIVLANLFVYMVMACQYESLVDPMVVMASVPLAAIGVVGLLYVTGTTFNVQSFIGMVMLAGIVVNNAIVLVDQIKLQRFRDHMAMVPAIAEAGRLRLRAILMTAATTILGLIPLALGLGDGGEAQAPMARAVLGGLSTSTFITLFVVPVVYSLAEPLRTRIDPAQVD